jgi:hypothetical protein
MADLEHDAQENTPLLGGMKQQGQQQQGQGSSYLWQQFKPPPPTLQQHQQDQVRVLGGGCLQCRPGGAVQHMTHCPSQDVLQHRNCSYSRLLSSKASLGEAKPSQASPRLRSVFGL